MNVHTRRNDGYNYGKKEGARLREILKLKDFSASFTSKIGYFF